MKKILVIVGPSGSGKTTVGEYLRGMGIPKLVSSTDRVPRKGETDGIDYHFVSREDFSYDRFVEYNLYSGHYYGLSIAEINSKFSAHDVVFCIVEQNGCQALKLRYGEQVISVGIHLDRETCRKRMIMRGDSNKNIKKRLKQYDELREGDIWQKTDLWIDGRQSPEEMLAEFRRKVFIAPKPSLDERIADCERKKIVSNPAEKKELEVETVTKEIVLEK